MTFDMDRSVLKSLNRHLYDELVRSMLKIIKKLDLSVQKVNSETEVSSFNATIHWTKDILPLEPSYDKSALLTLSVF